MNSEEIIKKIQKGREKLEIAKKELKNHFVGLDPTIDKIISNIEAWYCLPELQTRPTIVSIWGTTSVGKTDLVRRLVKSLDMQDRFVELQLTNQGSSQHYHTSIQGLLSSSNITPEESGILLLDEIQRFRSVGNDGKEIHDYNFQDVWMLLSDGSFAGSYDRKNDLMEMLFSSLSYQEYRSENEPEKDQPKKTESKEKKRKFQQSYWAARLLKRKLALSEPIEEIMTWDEDKKLKILTQKLEDKSAYKQEIYSKLLIFISGNLDEAYKMAEMVNEVDIDADIFHEYSLRINLLTIKQALTTRFKPEQISRFGNTHIIYPTLSRMSYETIIYKTIKQITEAVYQRIGVVVTLDTSVYQAIYRNGVFPTQGTRPVFSTIASFFESSLPNFTLKALQKGIKEIKLYYQNKCLTSQIGNELISILNEGDVDKIKLQKENKHQLCRIATHEAGHAITYAILLGYAPTQIVAVTGSEDKGGFVGFHQLESSYDLSCKKISILLAGKAAEELILQEKSNSSYQDLSHATTTAASMIRFWGTCSLSHVLPEQAPNAHLYNLDIKPTSEMIERLLQDQMIVTQKIIENNLLLLKATTDYLISNQKMEPEIFQKICKEHGIQIEVANPKEILCLKYKDRYESFWKENPDFIVRRQAEHDRIDLQLETQVREEQEVYQSIDEEG